MISSRFLGVSLLLLFFALVPVHAAKVNWKTRDHQGKKYVPMAQVKEFYEFSKMYTEKRRLVLRRPVVAKGNKGYLTLAFSIGGREVLMNGIKFILSNSMVSLGGSYHIAFMDLVKVVDPVLYPHTIKEATRFNTVILDPGHGGKDAGAVNRLGTEAGYNLKVAKLVQRHLLKAGFKVVMTRNSDRFLSLGERVALANKYDKAVFISIHFNAAGRSGRSRAQGMETFTLSPKGVAHYGRSLKSSDFISRKGNKQDRANIALATSVHAMSIDRLRRAKMKIPDRGIRRARFSVLTGIRHPAILLEGGFMTHPTESRLIHSERYQKIFAKSIADGIRFYRESSMKAPARKR